MTDTELLDGLQRLFDSKAVVLRTCHSGVKCEMSSTHIRYMDGYEQNGVEDYVEVFGSEGNDEPFGSDIRTAIKRILAV